MPLTERPEVQPKLARFDEEGLNDALDIAVGDDETRQWAIKALRENPRALIRRTFRLTPGQRLGLMRASDTSIREIANHVADLLEQGEEEAHIHLIRPGEEDLPANQMKASGEISGKFGCGSIVIKGKIET